MGTYDRKRLQAIKNLGGACACCGETYDIVLQIDHKNGDGADDRRTKSIYFVVSQLAEGRELDRFLLLCANCHRIKTTFSLHFGRNVDLQELTKLRSGAIRKGAKLDTIRDDAAKAMLLLTLLTKGSTK